MAGILFCITLNTLINFDIKYQFFFSSRPLLCQSLQFQIQSSQSINFELCRDAHYHSLEITFFFPFFFSFSFMNQSYLDFLILVFSCWHCITSIQLRQTCISTKIHYELQFTKVYSCIISKTEHLLKAIISQNDAELQSPTVNI